MKNKKKFLQEWKRLQSSSDNSSSSQVLVNNGLHKKLAAEGGYIGYIINIFLKYQQY